MVKMDEMRCALVALMGLPNAGKSTLINALVGEKVGIVSPKPNTTRVTVRGVVTEGANQLIFMDTPGLNRSDKTFDRRLVQQAMGAGQDADIVVFLVDVGGVSEKGAGSALSRSRQELERRGLLKSGDGRRSKLVIGLTKIDRIKDKKLLLPVLQDVNEWGADAVVPLSSPKRDGLAPLVKELIRFAPQGPWLFPAGQATDMPVALRLAEITREKAMRLLHEEVPYSVGVVTEAMSEGESEEEAPLRVQQQILVAKDQHKAMVVGKGGQMLKKIGMMARKEMQEILGCGVRLELHVKVAERWTEREDWLRSMGV